MKGYLSCNKRKKMKNPPYGIACVRMGGFYFTTSYRLDTLEKKVELLEANGEAIIRLEERVKGIQKKTDEIYKHIIEFLRSDSK